MPPSVCRSSPPRIRVLPTPPSPSGHGASAALAGAGAEAGTINLCCRSTASVVPVTSVHPQPSLYIAVALNSPKELATTFFCARSIFTSIRLAIGFTGCHVFTVCDLGIPVRNENT